MTRLFSGELRRVLARRMTRVLLAAAVLIIAVASVATFFHTKRISEASLAAARAQQVAGPCGPIQIGPNGPVPNGPNGPNGPTSGCFQDRPIRDPRFHLRSLKGILQGTTAPLVIAAWLIGASVIGADWQSRTLATILTWESRRVRVLLAKAVACMVVAAALTLVTFAVLCLALLPSAYLHGTTAGTGGGWPRSLVAAGLRGMAMTAMAAGMGFSIAAVAKTTAAALGAGFGYIVVVENVVGRFLEGWRRWLFLGNTIVFVGGHNSGGGVPGRSVLAAGMFLAAVTAAMLAIAAGTFRRRDVA
jgi:ABC-2 type transport system permease protein